MRLIFAYLLLFSFVATAQTKDKTAVCYIKGKVSWSADNRKWNAMKNMGKLLAPNEVISVGAASSIGVSCRGKCFIVEKEGKYSGRDLAAMALQRQSPLTEYLNPRYEFIVKNYMDYYKDPGLYCMSNTVNAKGAYIPGNIAFPADSEMLLADSRLFTWDRGHGDGYHLVILDDFNKPSLVEMDVKDTFAQVSFHFEKGHTYYWSVNASRNRSGYYNVFQLAGDEKRAAIRQELNKINAIKGMNDLNRIMITAIVYEDNKCWSEADKVLTKGLEEGKYEDLRLYYGLYLKRRGNHQLAKRYLD